MKFNQLLQIPFKLGSVKFLLQITNGWWKIITNVVVTFVAAGYFTANSKVYSHFLAKPDKQQAFKLVAAAGTMRPVITSLHSSWCDVTSHHSTMQPLVWRDQSSQHHAAAGLMWPVITVPRGSWCDVTSYHSTTQQLAWCDQSSQHHAAAGVMWPAATSITTDQQELAWPLGIIFGLPGKIIHVLGD